ncbi:MAG: hypothetical protein IKI28_08295 [Bacteroidales bacterium]|nr:hypothetical protein [Bacteroidales bacterium]
MAMKVRLLNHIDFNAIVPMGDKQMVELTGGGSKAKVIRAIINIIANDSNCICIANNCDCKRNQ